MKVYLTTIVKNEYKYIKEFVNHYINLGFDKIFIYDNNDVNGETYDNLLQEEINNGFIEIVNVRGLRRYQIQAYYDSYTKLKNENGWLFFLDVDEFLILNNSDNIKEFLSNNNFDNFNQILFNWLTMSDNNIIEYEDKPLMERFTKPVYAQKNVPEYLHDCTMNRHVKCCVRLNNEVNINMICPHCVNNIKNACDPNANPINVSPFNYHPDYSIAYIKHFQFKTIEEYVENKMKKGWADATTFTPNHYHDFFQKNELTIDKANWLIDYIFRLQNNLI